MSTRSLNAPDFFCFITLSATLGGFCQRYRKAEKNEVERRVSQCTRSAERHRVLNILHEKNGVFKITILNFEDGRWGGDWILFWEETGNETKRFELSSIDKELSSKRLVFFSSKRIQSPPRLVSSFFPWIYQSPLLFLSFCLFFWEGTGGGGRGILSLLLVGHTRLRI